jgi:NADP-dependent 3-hydroxy acid dehydrogenase YdfG
MEGRRRVLVTGASAGIGRHAALALSQRGFVVYAGARRVAALESLAREAGAGLVPVALDVNDATSIAEVAARILDETGGHGVDALVNNAGIAIAGPLADATDADIRAQFETNVFGVMAITRALLPQMIARRSGRIVMISSSGGQMSLPLVGVYHATKFALEALSDAYRWELHPFDIRVSIIEPGPIRTEFGDKLAASQDRIGATSVYAPLLEHLDRVQRFAEARMHGPEIVTRDIVHALTARRPRARYVEPRALGWLLALYRLAPTWLSDWVITRVTGLTPARLGAASAARPKTSG